MKRIFAVASIFSMLLLAGGLVYPPRSSWFAAAAGSWTEIGPAPTVNGTTTYIEPSSGRITGIAADPNDPNVIYVAAAGGGVWKTLNAGDPQPAWMPLTDTQDRAFMGAIAVAPSDSNTIYAGTGESNLGPSKFKREFRDNIYYGIGILKSANGGGAWTLVGGSQFFRRTISRIVVHPTDRDTVYVAVGALATNGQTGNMGIWKSTDGGTTWTNTTMNTVSPLVPFSDLVMDPADPQTLYAAVGAPGWDLANGVYKTTTGGDSWDLVPFPPPPFSQSQVGRIALAISPPLSPGGPRRLYAALARPGPPNSNFWSLYRLLRSGDGGNTWDPPLLTSDDKFCPSEGQVLNYLANGGDYHNTLAVDPVNPDTVYAAGICLIRSQSGGDVGTWETIADGDTQGPHRDHHALVFDAFGNLLDGNDGGIWRLDEPLFVAWSNLNGNLRTTQFVGLDLHPSAASFAYGGTQDTGIARYEGAPNLTWPRYLRGDGGATAAAVSVSNPPNIRVYQVTRLATPGSTTSSVFRRSDNGGVTYASKDLNAFRTEQKNWYFPVQMSPTNSNLLLVGTTNVWESTSGGDAWATIGGPGANGWPSCTVCDNIDSLAMDPSDATTTANTIYVSAGSHIFVTFDHGVTWNQRDIAGVDDPHVRSLVVDPDSKMTAYAVRDRLDGGRVFRTTNGGQSWTDISTDLPFNLPVNVIILDKRFTPKTLYVGTDAGVYVSTDQGAHWTRFGTGFPNAQVVELKLNTTLSILAAGTHGRGVWEISLGLKPTR